MKKLNPGKWTEEIDIRDFIQLNYTPYEGYNAYGYLGAYIEMPSVEKIEKKQIRRCSDVNCSNHKNEKMSKDSHFCSKCGTEIEEYEKHVS